MGSQRAERVAQANRQVANRGIRIRGARRLTPPSIEMRKARCRKSAAWPSGRRERQSSTKPLLRPMEGVAIVLQRVVEARAQITGTARGPRSSAFSVGTGVVGCGPGCTGVGWMTSGFGAGLEIRGNRRGSPEPRRACLARRPRSRPERPRDASSKYRHGAKEEGPSRDADGIGRHDLGVPPAHEPREREGRRRRWRAVRARSRG